MVHASLEDAVTEAAKYADSLGESFCVVSGMKGDCRIFRVYSLKGFGLPSGGILEKVVEPRVEREEIEPPEKISSNGF